MQFSLCFKSMFFYLFTVSLRETVKSMLPSKADQERVKNLQIPKEAGFAGKEEALISGPG